MYSVVLASPRLEALGDLTAAISSQPDITLHQVDSREAVLQAARELKPDLVILDEKIGEGNSLGLVKELLGVNAMINTAMITGIRAEQWHEESEGLGMLPPLPDPPTGNDGLALLKQLREISGLL